MGSEPIGVQCIFYNHFPCVSDYIYIYIIYIYIIYIYIYTIQYIYIYIYYTILYIYIIFIVFSTAINVEHHLGATGCCGEDRTLHS